MSYIHSQNQNQLTQSLVVGQLSMIGNPEILSVRLNPASTAYFQAGTPVKLLTSATGKEIVVDAVSGATDGPVFGVLKHNLRSDKPVKGQVVEIAGIGSYIWLEASAAIAVGATVAGKPGVAGTSDPQVTTDVTSAHYITGIAVTSAAAEGDLVLVRITPSKNA